ncbi:TetR/AcrR family transcriptional regulator [Georgenia subflava]|uniref:TetR family transcriptional regulator n=1 Tax=Georgenia subflava TaxID=1622177 RepID=A0A6N7EMP4_9MICO|nr:TetR/AcrR family transcriptional regulator [Georgenia subflava]MPV37416.1 TetR family transcriptional regulator [Georgenia subflava]
MTHNHADVVDGSTPVRRGPGRPRHADTEERAYRAVLELFGQRGWAGLSLDGVATHAGIGKSSIYLRWKDKRDLLLDALRDLEAHYVTPEETEGMTLREYLVAHAEARANLYLGEYGPAVSHLHSAALANPEEFHEIRQESISRGVLSLHGRIERAISSGELPADTSAHHLLDAIEGAILIHVLVSSPKRTEDLKAGIHDYVRTLVDLQLKAVGAPD